MGRNFKTLLLIGCIAVFSSCGKRDAMGYYSAAGNRVRTSIDFDWKFFKGDIARAENVDFDDANWESINIPHDWSIEGPFSSKWASGTGYLPGGIGWYRKYFNLPEQYQDKKVFIEFDGVYMNSDVWINGHHLGKRPYGYISFCYDLTPYLNYGDNKNILAVKVDHTKFADSRWYTGSGIYRPVWLVATDNPSDHLDQSVL